MTIGIYSIKNKKNGKVYIGSSINCEYRFKQHQKELRAHSHGNDHLQKAINKYGMDNFEFNIIAECNEADLITKEDEWINKFNSMDSRFGYNKQSADRSFLTEEAKKNHKDACNTQKFKDTASKNSKEKIWGNEEVKNRLLKNQWSSMHTDKHRKLKSDQRQLAWDTHPEIKKEFSEKFKEKWESNESPNRNKSFSEFRGSDEQKQMLSETFKEKWKNPEFREKMIEARKTFGATEEFKKKVSENSKKMWANKKFKNKRHNEMKEFWAKNKSEIMKKRKEKFNQVEAQCEVCKKIFKKNISNQKVCSKECKNKYRKVLRELKKKNQKIILPL